MDLQRILYPTDFSTCSDAGIALATSLAKGSDATLLILHVEEASPEYEGEAYYGPPVPEREFLEHMLRHVKPTDPEVRYQHIYQIGDPAETILRIARERQAGLIVMGTHGRTGLKRLLLGSIAEQVLRRAPCPVFTFSEKAVRREKRFTGGEGASPSDEEDANK